MTHRVVLEPVLILHRRPYRNTSLLIELFSLNHGRLSVVARSARGLKSRYKGQLQLFAPMLFSWSGTRELKSLGQVELYGAPYSLEGDHLLCGFYLNELLLKLLHKEDPHPHLFRIYQETLARLSDGRFVEKNLRIFEKQLLEELGYALPLKRDAGSGEPIVADHLYHYIPERGFFYCDVPNEEMLVFSGSSLLALAKEQLEDEEDLLQAKRLMRVVLARHLGAKPLKSRELMG